MVPDFDVLLSEARLGCWACMCVYVCVYCGWPGGCAFAWFMRLNMS